jgi:hypothetical protein
MKARFMFVAAGLAVLAPAAAAQPGPSFDCSKAEHEIEELICKDDGLAAGGQAGGGLSQAGGPEAILKTTQRGWIGGRMLEGNDKRVHHHLYDRRTAFLKPFQSKLTPAPTQRRDRGIHPHRPAICLNAVSLEIRLRHTGSGT